VRIQVEANRTLPGSRNSLRVLWRLESGSQCRASPGERSSHQAVARASFSQSLIDLTAPGFTAPGDQIADAPPRDGNISHLILSGRLRWSAMATSQPRHPASRSLSAATFNIGTEMSKAWIPLVEEPGGASAVPCPPRAPTTSNPSKEVIRVRARQCSAGSPRGRSGARTARLAGCRYILPRRCPCPACVQSYCP